MKTHSGLLFPAVKFSIHPQTNDFHPIRNMQNVEFERYGSSRRIRSIYVFVVDRGGKLGQYTFTSIRRDEYTNLPAFLQPRM